MKNRNKVMNILVIGILLFMVGVQTGTMTLSPISPVFAADVDYSAEDLAQFMDTNLENITALLSGSGAGAGASIEGGTIVHISKASIRASTMDYKVFSAVEEDVLHNANPTFLKSYWSFAKATGIRSLKTIYSMSMSAGMGASISGTQALLSAMAANDTADATGFNAEVEDEFSIDSLDDEGTKYYMDYNNYTYLAEVDTEYSNLLDDLNEEDTGKNLLSGDEEKEILNHQAIVLGFDDTEQDILKVLRANIAANNSDSTTTYTASDITILDYDFKTAEQTSYMSDNFINRIRGKIDEILEGETESAMMISFFGFTFRFTGILVPTKAYVNSIQFDLFGSIKGMLDRTVKTARSFVSNPIRTTREVIKKVGDTTRKVTEFVVKNHPVTVVAGTLAKQASKTLGYLRGAVSKPLLHPALKAVPEPMKDPGHAYQEDFFKPKTITFSQKVSTNATDLISPTADEIEDNADKATQMTSQATNEMVIREKPKMPITWIAIAGVAIVGFLLLIAGIWLWRRRKSIVPI